MSVAWYRAVRSSRLRELEDAPRPRVVTDRDASDDTGMHVITYDRGWVCDSDV